ncbi:MAG TPA: TIGR01777 family oxidoreductase [Myxococcota bacterium]|jgi:hypothetical protein
MSSRQEVLVSGASGLVGRRLLASFARDRVAVRALTRRPEAAPPLASPHRWLGWDGSRFPADAVAGAAGVVHLAGEPVFAGRLTPARRARILESRTDSTRSLAAAIGALPAPQRPRVLVSASAVGFYGSRGDQILDEDAAPGEGFLAEVCRAWETEALAAARHGVRCVVLRIGIVLAREGGALPRMALPFRAGLGGRLGDGRQWFPWIHADDLVSLIRAALRDEGYTGAVNAVAPGPVRNAELTRALARVLHRPAFFAVPAFALRAALGELSGELLGSRRCVPRRALARGFVFAHPGIDAALAAELA